MSGNELDSSESEEEDKSEDDPDKLWCICNQPHNNRFMICCDTCEEWYHGKCVNVTKAMGQLMEQEGKEWICVYCKVILLVYDFHPAFIKISHYQYRGLTLSRIFTLVLDSV